MFANQSACGSPISFYGVPPDAGFGNSSIVSVVLPSQYVPGQPWPSAQISQPDLFYKRAPPATTVRPNDLPGPNASPAALFELEQSAEDEGGDTYLKYAAKLWGVSVRARCCSALPVLHCSATAMRSAVRRSALCRGLRCTVQRDAVRAAARSSADGSPALPLARWRIAKHGACAVEHSSANLA